MKSSFSASSSSAPLVIEKMSCSPDSTEHLVLLQEATLPRWSEEQKSLPVCCRVWLKISLLLFAFPRWSVWSSQELSRGFGGAAKGRRSAADTRGAALCR